MTTAPTSPWPDDPTLRRWRDGLEEHVGLSTVEVEARQAALLQFCRAHGCTPGTLVAACRDGPERLQRQAHYLTLASASPARLIVQSFLIHNGVNVFGEIVCMPATPAQVRAEQGAGWVAAGAAPTGYDDD